MDYSQALTVIGAVTGCLSCIPLGIGIYVWHKKRKVLTFHRAVSPLLSEIKSGFGDRLNPAERRGLVRQSVKLASMAVFGKERPEPDPESRGFAYFQEGCRFCGYDMHADDRGCCQDCGLGCRHWLSRTAAPNRGSNMRVQPSEIG